MRLAHDLRHVECMGGLWEVVAVARSTLATRQNAVCRIVSLRILTPRSSSLVATSQRNSMCCVHLNYSTQQQTQILNCTPPTAHPRPSPASASAPAVCPDINVY